MSAYIKKMVERDKKIIDEREFTIEQKPCYFCDEKEQIRFGEHWLFCPKCAAIYTYMVVHRIGCGHINTTTPVVLNRCWLKNHRRIKIYIKYMDAELQVCSKCGMHCEADGW